MLAEKSGPLYQPLALELIERHPAYADLPNHAPARGPDRTPPWLAKTGQDARSQVTDFLTADENQRLGTIAKKGFMRIQASQQKQVRAYARRRCPNNKRIEVCEVGSRCRISIRNKASRGNGIATKLWEKDFYTISGINDRRIEVHLEREPDDRITVLKEDLIPSSLRGWQYRQRQTWYKLHRLRVTLRGPPDAVYQILSINLNSCVSIS